MRLMRKQVYEAIDTERAYQDRKWGGENHDEQHCVADWVIFMNKHIADAMMAVYNLDNVTAMDSVRKIAALAVAAMENRGVRGRNN